MTSTPLAALQPQRPGQALSPAATELPLLLFHPHGGVVLHPLTNVSFESSVLVSSGVSLHHTPYRLVSVSSCVPSSRHFSMVSLWRTRSILYA